MWITMVSGQEEFFLTGSILPGIATNQIFGAIVHESFPQYSGFMDYLESEIPEMRQYNILGGERSSEIKVLRKIEDYSLEIPIILSVSYQEDSVFVEDEYLNLWGEGDSIEEAIKSFEDFFLYDFESYKDTPLDRMDFYAQEKLRYYKYLLKIT